MENTNKISNTKSFGRWSKAEKKKFIWGFKKYGKNWKLIKKMIPTRSLIQIRSHAQKFLKNFNEKSNHSEKNDLLLYEKINQKLIDKIHQKYPSQNLEMNLFKNTNSHIRNTLKDLDPKFTDIDLINQFKIGFKSIKKLDEMMQKYENKKKKSNFDFKSEKESFSIFTEKENEILESKFKEKYEVVNHYYLINSYNYYNQ